MARRIHGASVVALALAGCSAEAFTCQQDSACEGAGPGARCELSGYCSFEDPDCDGGRRYGTFAGEGLGGQCVVDQGGTESSTTTTTTTTGQESLDDTGDASGGDTGPPPSDWWDCAWAARRPLTLEPPAIGEAQADVPVLIVLDGSRIDFTLAAADGHDLRFVSDDGTVLPFEIEQWSPSSLAWIWLQVPELLPAGSAVHMYYGNPEAPPAQGSAVWSDYQGVWHMGPKLPDATGQGNVTESDALPREGHVAGAHLHTPSEHGMRSPATPHLDGLFAGGGTLTAMVRIVGWGGSGQGQIVARSGNREGTGGWSFQINEGRQALRFSRDFEMSRGNWYSPDGSLSLFTWHHVAVVYEDAADAALEPSLYIDGVLQPLDLAGSPGGMPVPEESDQLDIGGVPGAPGRWFHGLIDEVRVADVPRSPDWMAVQNASLRDDLVRYGAPQSSPCSEPAP